MKRLLLPLLLVAGLLATGCVKYRVTLNNGQTFEVLGKPKFDQASNTYTYKAGGQPQVISAGRVVSIEPASSSTSSENPQSSGY